MKSGGREVKRMLGRQSGEHRYEYRNKNEIEGNKRISEKKNKIGKTVD